MIILMKKVIIDKLRKEELYPAFSSNNISIMMVSSEAYLPYCAVCITSIMENANINFNYDILIMQSTLSNNSIEVIKNFEKKYSNCSIRCIDLKEYLDEFESVPIEQRITRDIYYRTIAPFVLENYNKMLVIDIDLVVNSDISELYNFDVDNYMVAAVRDIVICGFLNGANEIEKKYYLEECILKNPYNYINTGVMLQNYDKIRKNYTIKQYVEVFTKKKYHIQEQDSMNLLFDGNIKFLNIEWNVNPYNYAIKRKWIAAAPEDMYEEYKKARNTPKIIHWAGSIKPWNIAELDMAQYFWCYARKSSVYEILLSRLMKFIINNTNNKNNKSLKNEVLKKIKKYVNKIFRRF